MGSGDLVQGPGEWEQEREWEWEWELEVVDLGEGFHLHSGSNASGFANSQLETDTSYTLADFSTFPACQGCQVHGGYYLAWVSVVDQVQSLLQEEASRYPDYGIVITGHR